MTKKEIVKQISDRANLTQLRTKEIVQWTFDAIIETLENEGRIELRNFGVFEVKVRKARTARNPKTNEEVEVAEKRVVTFQPGKVMEERVRKSASLSGKKKGRKPLAEDFDEPVTVGAGAGLNGDGIRGHDDGETYSRHELPLKPR